jgi:hypothetical protein
MATKKYDDKEYSRRADEMYEGYLRAKVEHGDNIGKFITFDIDTGEYEIGDDLYETGEKIRERNPEAQLVTHKIGYNAAISFGGTLQRRTDPSREPRVLETAA